MPGKLGKDTGKPHWRVYLMQVHNAKRRGVSFLLTYAQWLSIWKRSGRLADRGRKRHQYCMARKGDAGPYAIRNVVIMTNSDNQKENVKARLACLRPEAKAKRSASLVAYHAGRTPRQRSAVTRKGARTSRLQKLGSIQPKDAAKQP